MTSLLQMQKYNSFLIVYVKDNLHPDWLRRAQV